MQVCLVCSIRIYLVDFNPHKALIMIYFFSMSKIARGDIQAASEWYRKAYEVSCLVSGEHSVTTLDLQALALNTPKNVKEVRAEEGGKE
jgi:hypothetical protein